MPNKSPYIESLQQGNPVAYSQMIDRIKSMVPEMPPYDHNNKEESQNNWIRATYQRESILNILKELGE